MPVKIDMFILQELCYSKSVKGRLLISPNLGGILIMIKHRKIALEWGRTELWSQCL